MNEAITNKLVLASTYAELEKIEPFVNKLQQQIPLTESDFDRILLCLNEAVNNAVIHGNNRDPNKHVIIETRYFPQQHALLVHVQDEGEGFNPHSLPDPLAEENLLNEGGRGVFLIKQYAEELRFSNNGTKVTITFELAS